MTTLPETDTRLQSIHDHTIRTDLMSSGSWTLDVGCRDFKFAKAMVKLGQRVLSLDPSRDITDPKIDGITFESVALVHDDAEELLFAEHDGEDNHLVRLGVPGKPLKQYKVPCANLPSLMRKHGIVAFDIVKLDCESAEYDILRHWPSPITRQISVEFHDFMKMRPTPDYHEKMMEHLGKWYRPVQYGEPFTDCLFVRG